MEDEESAVKSSTGLANRHNPPRGGPRPIGAFLPGIERGLRAPAVPPAQLSLFTTTPMPMPPGGEHVAAAPICAPEWIVEEPLAAAAGRPWVGHDRGDRDVVRVVLRVADPLACALPPACWGVLDGTDQVEAMWALRRPVLVGPNARAAPIETLGRVVENLAHALDAQPVPILHHPDRYRAIEWHDPKTRPLADFKKLLPFGWRAPGQKRMDEVRTTAGRARAILLALKSAFGPPVLRTAPEAMLWPIVGAWSGHPLGEPTDEEAMRLFNVAWAVREQREAEIAAGFRPRNRPRFSARQRYRQSQRKARRGGRPRIGEGVVMAVLLESADGSTQTDIAARHGIGRATVQRILYANR